MLVVRGSPDTWFRRLPGRVSTCPGSRSRIVRVADVHLGRGGHRQCDPLLLTAVQVLVDRLADSRRRGRSGVRSMDRPLVDSEVSRCSSGRSSGSVREACLPRPITQRRIKRDGKHVARVDFLYADERVIVEVTGRLGHSMPTDRGRTQVRSGVRAANLEHCCHARPGPWLQSARILCVSARRVPPDHDPREREKVK